VKPLEHGAQNSVAQTRVSEWCAPVYFPLHRALWTSDTPYSRFILEGGRGSGKSSIIALEIVYALLQDPMHKREALVLRKVSNTLRESVLAQLKWAAEKITGLEHWDVTTSPMRMIFKPTRQRIVFMGCDDPAKLKSLIGNFEVVWFEEITEFKGELVRNEDTGEHDLRTEIEDSIYPTVARRFNQVFFHSYNPPASSRTWVNMWTKAKRNDPKFYVQKTSYLDIEPMGWLPPDFIYGAERMKAERPKEYEHIYLGEQTGTGLEVFHNLVEHPNGIPEDILNRCEEVGMGVDFGFTIDPTVIVFCQFGETEHPDYPGLTRKELVIRDEFYRTGLTTGQMAERIRAMQDKWDLDINRCAPIADSASPLVIAELRGLGVPMRSARKKPGSRDRGWKWLQDLYAIHFDPHKTPNAARELALSEYGVDQQGLVKARYPTKNDHVADALRYCAQDWMREKWAL